MTKEKWKIKRATSSGGIIYKKQKHEIKVALCARGKGKIWCLPKGLINKNEKSEEAAKREVKEETGLAGKLIDKIGDIDYWFIFKGTKIHKVVHFYLFKYLSGSTADHDFEVDNVKWLSINEAIKRLTYKNEAEIMKKAKRMISKS